MREDIYGYANEPPKRKKSVLRAVLFMKQKEKKNEHKEKFEQLGGKVDEVLKNVEGNGNTKPRKHNEDVEKEIQKAVERACVDEFTKPMKSESEKNKLVEGKVSKEILDKLKAIENAPSSKVMDSLTTLSFGGQNSQFTNFVHSAIAAT